jgi:hypothetical protein
LAMVWSSGRGWNLFAEKRFSPMPGRDID